MDFDNDLLSSENFNKELSSLYNNLSMRAEMLYKFVILYHSYIYASHNYGMGFDFTMMEIHTITFIEDNPGVTVTELAKIWSKTKSAVSQTVKKLVDSGYVERQNEGNDNKTVHLYVTETGKRASIVHKAYDVADINQTMSYLTEKCGAEDFNAFFRVLQNYIELLEQ